jgi:hypothetical protein
MAIAFYQPQVRDSILRPQQADTVSAQPNQESHAIPGDEDSAVGYFSNHPGEIIRIQSSAIILPPVKVEQVPVREKSNFILPDWNFNTNFFVENDLTRTVVQTGFFRSGETSYPVTGSIKPGNIIPRGRNIQNLDWFLSIFLMITLLFIWIRLFYGKYFSLLANELTSYQISAKLFRERNVLMRRVSIVMDFIYIVVFSVFVFELAVRFNVFASGLSRFNQYMLLLNIIMLYSLFRIALLRFTGFLFLNRNLFSEYIHNTFVVNKGTGIILFPVVITAHYFPLPLASWVLICGLAILVVAFIWKSIRAYQIIKRKDVVLFYLILYLCTLEFLPLLIGYKLFISLI